MFYRVKLLSELEYRFEFSKDEGAAGSAAYLYNHDMSRSLIELSDDREQNIARVYVACQDDPDPHLEIHYDDAESRGVNLRFSDNGVTVYNGDISKKFEVAGFSTKDIAYAKFINVKCPEHLLSIGIEGGPSGFDLASLEYTILASRVERLESLVASLIQSRREK